MSISMEKATASCVLSDDLMEIQISIENARAVLESVYIEFFGCIDPKEHIDTISLTFDRYYKYTRAAEDCLYRANERINALMSVV